MRLLKMLWRSNFLIKLRHWEYWPFGAVYWPVFFYWLWLSLKSRSFFYFTASNPGIENGGMLGETKIKILDKISDELKPKTIFIKSDEGFTHIIQLLKINNLNYPIICKPDIGERGWRVEKIQNQDDLQKYHEQISQEYLIQEFLPHPIEMGIFYYRYPNEEKGRVSSIVIKEMLYVSGDGASTLQELILANDRAKLHWESLQKKYADNMADIPTVDEKIELVSIGNHCKGTKFLDGNYLITPQLHKTFDSISLQIDGFFFGRFDIKVNSLDDLYVGKIKIMELNGAGAEPSHIYQPGYSILDAYKTIFHHWQVLYEISIANHKAGIPFLTFKQGLAEYRKSRALTK